MSIKDLDRLATLVQQKREDLLSRWRLQVRELPSAKSLDIPTLNDHIPMLLDELALALRTQSEQTIPEAVKEGSAPIHGLQRFKDAFDIEEVVAEYNILRGCIHDLAGENDLNLQGKSFHIINRVFDSAIGIAVQSYATARALEVQRRREEYLAFVAHDLRTPLNAISLSGRVLEGTFETARTPEAERMFKALRRNITQLEKLVDQILEESTHLETETGVKLERREFDLWPLVEGLIHFVHPVAGTDSTQLINQVPDDLVVYADAELVKRILQNLIANAIRYTPRGEVVIEASNVPEEAVVCSVRDNGAGIPAAFLEKVFDKGETDPANDKGTGLGLAIVKTLTEAHGGKVSAESEEGTGSIFRFSLPIKAQVVASKG